MADIAKALSSAADLIEEWGWCQGRFENESGNLCAVGAIWTTRVRGTDHFDVEYTFKDALGMSVAEWNDAPERTQDEVVAKLREVALKVAK